jgi:Flp pilus assembly protein TadD
MQTSPNQNASDVDAQVGQAWTLHYHGQNDEAIRAFQQILEKNPEHVDANYGLALSLKASGKRQEAQQTFLKTKSLTEAAAKVENTDENTRYRMITRMIEQQLAGL